MKQQNNGRNSVQINHIKEKLDFSFKIIHYPLFGTDPDRNRVTWETPSSEAIPSIESHLGYTPPTQPSANAGMKRTSVVEHNLYFTGLAILG
jgi:hypothetical protein